MALKQAIVVRTDLKMGKGKASAQVAHASVAVLEKADQSIVRQWKEEGMKKVVLKISGKKELLELFEEAKKRLPTALIKDAGLTQIKPGEPTCIAIGPAKEEELDRITGELKLL
jgi:PTH2 family peptidyl-tRNA hydrolase